jgi:hypothetical protein
MQTELVARSLAHVQLELPTVRFSVKVSIVVVEFEVHLLLAMDLESLQVFAVLMVLMLLSLAVFVVQMLIHLLVH